MTTERPMIRSTILAATAILFLSQALPAQESSQLDRVRALGTPSIAGEISTYHSPGYRDRAIGIRDVLESARTFFEDSLGTELEVNLALLSEEHWSQTTEIDYGIPFFSGSVMVLPATTDVALTRDFQNLEGRASEEDLARIAASGLTFQEAAHLTIDLIGYHELGHAYVYALGILPPTRWFSELLASYFAYAFLSRRQADPAAVWETMWGLKARAPRPSHTTLADFENLYIEVGIENYLWYQAQFQQRIEEVFASDGLAFVRRVAETFPADAGASDLSRAEVMARLEELRPGFVAWARGFEDGGGG